MQEYIHILKKAKRTENRRNRNKEWRKKIITKQGKKVIEILDFKLSMCSEYCMLSSG